MKRDNKVGPALLHGLPRPPRLEADALATLAGRTDVVVLDTRRRDEFLTGHLPGSLLAELDYQFPTVAGSYVEEGAAIYLVVDGERVDEAVRSLVRIGLDGIRGYLTPATLDEYAAGGGRLTQTETIDMVELERRRLGGGVTILDVRGSAEYAVHHVPGALNIAHTRLLVRLDEVPVDRPVIVHCNSGGRSAAAAALLERHGYRVADVDDLISSYRPGVRDAARYGRRARPAGRAGRCADPRGRERDAARAAGAEPHRRGHGCRG
jgi:hydroxyacylglutathione hydrolase